MKIIRTQLCFGLFLAGTLLSGCKDRDSVKVYRVSKEEPAAPAPKASGPESSGMGGMPQMGAPADAVAPAGNAPAGFTGAPPSDWEAQPLTAMRQASYLVKGDGGATADISLIVLGGAAGGAIDNVNRWLSQLGQPAITAEQLAQKATHVTSPLGDVTVVDFEGLPNGADAAKDGRIVAGIVSGDGRTLFFKMRGNAALAASQKEAFVRWIGTVRAADAGQSPPHP